MGFNGAFQIMQCIYKLGSSAG